MSESSPTPLKIGDWVRVTASGMSYLRQSEIPIENLTDAHGNIYGTIIDDGPYMTVEMGKSEKAYFGAGEIEAATPPPPATSVVELANLLTTYRMSEDDEEVAAAQELLLEYLTRR